MTKPLNAKWDAHLSKAVANAVDELHEMRKAGQEVCDTAYIRGAMSEAAKSFDGAISDR